MFVINRVSARLAQNNISKTVSNSRNCHSRATASNESIWASKPDPKYTETEEVVGHWPYVEKLFFQKAAADAPKTSSVAGWHPPHDTPPNLPYFIARTRNHMLPVYESVDPRGWAPVAVVRRIKGDIWQFAKDIKPHLQKDNSREIRVRVDEVCEKIFIRNGCVKLTKQWLYDKGF